MPEHESNDDAAAEAVATLTLEERAVESSLRELLTLPTPAPDFDARVLAAARVQAKQARRPVLRALRGGAAWFRPAVAAAAILLSAGVILPATAPRQVALAPAMQNPLSVSPLRGARVVSAAGALGRGGHPLTVGSWVDTGDPLVVRPDGHLLLALAEGTELAFDGGSQATLRFDRRVRGIELTRGRLYADVVKVGSTSEGRPIVLNTPAGVARVLGTELTARVSRAATRLTVRHGLVRLANSHGSAYVGADETGLLTGALSPRTRRTSTVDRHFRWIGKLQPGGHHSAEKVFGGGSVGEDEPAIGSLVARGPDGRPVTLALAEQAFTATIQDGIAHTTVRFSFRNDSSQDLEGTFRFALPKAASISRYAVLQDEGWVEGRVVEREQARRIYAEQKRLLKEPALLEWAAGSAFQAQVFPIKSRSVKQLEVSYVEELPERRGVSRLVLPLVSEASRLMPPERLRVTCRLLGAEARAALRCPSHYADVGWDGGARVIQLVADDLQPRNDFVLELGRPTAPGVEARLEAGVGGGPATVLVRVRPDLSWLGDDVAPSRVVFLVDASGSQAGTLKEVQLELLEGLLNALPARVRPRLFVHHVGLEELNSDGPDFDEGLLAALWHSEVGGASDLASAFRTLGRALPSDAGVTLVYLGDGVATTGERDVAEIARAFREGLPPSAVQRLITVGVGADTDAVLLDALAREREGIFVGVRPGDDLGLKVDEAASALTEPVLTQVVVELGGDVEAVTPTAPTNLRDGETLSLSARLRGDVRRLPVTVSGVVAGRSFRTKSVVELRAAAPGAQLGDLWARRRVADLLLEGASRKDDVLDLALDHGIVTPYTSLVVLSAEEFARYQLEDQNRRHQRDVARLARQAQELAAAGDLEAATRLAVDLLARDPGHRGGQWLLSELTRHSFESREELVRLGELAAQTKAPARYKDLIENYRRALAEPDPTDEAGAEETILGLELASAWDGKPRGLPSSGERDDPDLAEVGDHLELALPPTREQSGEALDKLLEANQELTLGSLARGRLRGSRNELDEAVLDATRSIAGALDGVAPSLPVGGKSGAPAGPPAPPVSTRDAPDSSVEQPIIVLEEEVEVTQDVPRGTDLSSLSNKNLDGTSVVDAYGVGGGAAGVYGDRWSRREGEELDRKKESRGEPVEPANGAPSTGGEWTQEERLSLDGFLAVEDVEHEGRFDDELDARLSDARPGLEELAKELPGALKTVATADALFREGKRRREVAEGQVGRLSLLEDELEDALLVDRILGSGTKQGYAYSTQSDPAKDQSESLWSTRSNPALPGTTGDRFFSTNEEGVVYGWGARKGALAAPGEDAGLSLADVPVLGGLFRAIAGDKAKQKGEGASTSYNLRQLGLAATQSSGDEHFFAAQQRPQIAETALRGELVGLVRDLDASAPDERGRLFDSLSALCFDLVDAPRDCMYLAGELLRYGPQDLDLHELIGRCLESLGRPLDAVRAYSGLVEARPDDASARLRYGLALERLGFDDLALAAFAEAVALDEGLPEPRFALVRLAVRSGRLEVAEAQLKELLARNFDPAEHGDVASLARGGLSALYQRGSQAWPEQAELFGRAAQALAAGAYERRAVRLQLRFLEGQGELVVRGPGDPVLTAERPFAPSGGLLRGLVYDHAQLGQGSWAISVRAAGPVRGVLTVLLNEGTPQQVRRDVPFASAGSAALWEGELR